MTFTKTTTTIILATLMLGATFATTYLQNAYAVPPPEGTVLATLNCAGSGVGIGFDGTTLYWLDFGGGVLHRCDTAGNVLSDIPILGCTATVISWDSARGQFWGAASTSISLIDPVTGICTPQFTITSTPGDCDNIIPFGFNICLSLIDGIAYDASDDSIWWSPDASQRAYHYDTAGNLLGFFDTNDPPNDQVPECGFNYQSGLAAGTTNVMWVGANGCTFIFKYDKTGTKLGAVSLGLGRTEDLECDNVTFASLGTDAIWTKDAFTTTLEAFAVERGTCILGGGGEPEPQTGRMTGGGSVLNVGTMRVTHGFELHCDEASLPNNLQVNWDKGNKFHMETLDTANCSDDSSISEVPPVAGFDTYVGTGTGRLNGVSGATIEFEFTDAGEPGKNDLAKIVIKVGTTTVLSVSGNLNNGNHQAHAE